MDSHCSFIDFIVIPSMCLAISSICIAMPLICVAIPSVLIVIIFHTLSDHHAGCECQDSFVDLGRPPKTNLFLLTPLIGPFYFWSIWLPVVIVGFKGLSFFIDSIDFYCFFFMYFCWRTLHFDMNLIDVCCYFIDFYC